MIRHPGVVGALLAVTLAATLARAEKTPLAVAAHARLGHATAALVDRRGRLPVLFDLPPGADPREYRAHRVAGDVASRWVERSELDAFLRLTGGLHPWVGPPLRPLLNVSGAQWTHATAAHQQMITGKGVVVGVVDTGLDVAHPDFRTAGGKSRVKWMIDMGRQPAGKHPDLEAQFGCSDPDGAPCAILTGDEIDAEIAAKSPDTSVDPEGHGTHVTSIAAGNGGNGKKYVGVAPEADLVVAQVTRDGSITDADILNGTKFVFDRAAFLGESAVVNLSLGGDFGPHDGTSPLERGLLSLVGAGQPGRAITIAAGNSGSVCEFDGHVFGTHTEVRLIDGEVARIGIASPDASGGTRQGAAFAWLRFDDGATAKVGLERNGSTVVDEQDDGDEDQPAASGGFEGAVINGVTGGDSPLVAGNRGAIVTFDGPYQPSDTFSIVLEGHGLVEIWLQGTGDAESSAPCSGLALDGAIKQGTINTPASADGLIGVGCSLNRVSWSTRDGFEVEVPTFGSVDDPPTDTVCYFSASGPNANGTPKPEILAPGGFVVGAMAAAADPSVEPNSLFAAPAGVCPEGSDCLVVDDTHGVATGTSMSSPQAAGAIALLFQQQPTLTQPEALALLQGGARRTQGLAPFDYQSGPGGLDVTGAFEALRERGMPRDLAPAGDRSWLVMGAGFARPSSAFPVTGTLVLRAADGGIADGFDDKDLRVAVENGAVQGQPTRQGPGVYAFKVVADAGGAGEDLVVTAFYGETQLGDRKTLPIQQDAFLVAGTVTAHGGCAVADPGEGGPLAVMALLGAARARKSSRRGARTAPRRAAAASTGRARRR